MIKSKVDAQVEAIRQEKELKKPPNEACSASLDTRTHAPGWTAKESELLKHAMMKFGVGKWGKLRRSGLLPHKKLIQSFIETQRLLG